MLNTWTYSVETNRPNNRIKTDAGKLAEALRGKILAGAACAGTKRIDMDHETYHAALRRNLNELVIAGLEFDAYREIGDKLLLDWYDSFFVLAQDALFNDMVAHMIKVLDQNSQSATFWYMFRYKSEEVKEFVRRENIDFMAIYDIAEKLKIVRDKTHFHIDKKGVRNPKAVWSSANITYDDLQENMESVYRILNHLHTKEFDSEFSKPKIDNLQYIIQAAVDAGYATKRSPNPAGGADRG